jgi:chromosome partitioning protein
VVAVCNLKGGAGKSTLAVNLACALTTLGGDVVLLDNDEQGSTAAWAAAGRLPVRCVHLPLPRLEDLPSWMSRLAALRAGPSVVVVDTPATVALALGATLLAASTVLIPCAPNDLEIAATQRMLGHIRRLRDQRADDPPTVLIVPNRVGGPGLEDLAACRRRLAGLGEELAPALGARPEYTRAFSAGRWVGDCCPGSVAEQEVLALAGVVCDRFVAPVLPSSRPAHRPPAASLARALLPGLEWAVRVVGAAAGTR